MSYRSGAGALRRVSLVRVALALVALVAFAVLSVDRAQGASSVVPELREGTTVCSDVKPQRKEVLVAPPVVGTHAFGDDTLTGSYTLGDDNHLAWTSDDLSVDYVLVHATDGATNYYQYPGGTKGDADLVAPGDAVIDAVRFCYDNQNRGTVRIVKQTDPDGASDSFSFHPSAELSPDDFQLSDDQSTEFRPKPGTYTVDEADTAGWKVSEITCDDDNSTASGSKATIVVDPGETVTCTFHNAKVRPAPPAPPAAVQAPKAPTAAKAASAPAPKLVVKSVVARRGTARLRRPARCVSGRFQMTVAGSPVRRIVFTVNGHRVKTVIARSGRRTFTVTLPAARVTVQRVAARVTFANGARSRTLRTTVLRCAPRRVAQPQFTG
jgi:hypothetical protein